MANEDQREEEITKRTTREKIWKYMMKNELLNYPKKVYNKIPNFKGAAEAVERLVELQEFKDAKLIQISLDKPLELVQEAALKAGKEIVIPIPKLKNGFVRVPPPDDGKFDEHFIPPTRQLQLKGGQSILKIGHKLNIDFVVIGSVCVDRAGHRIGKGLGFADLEYAMMMKMGSIKPETTVITIVHDSQVVDKLSDNLFQKHDVHVDIIVTPTETIVVNEKLKKPEGVYWDILTQRRVNAVQLLQQMKEFDEKEGKEIVLKEEDPNDVPHKLSLVKKLARKEARESRKNNRKPKSEENTTEDENKGKENVRVSRKRQPRHRKADNKVENKADTSVDNEKNEKTTTPVRKPIKHRSRVQVDYTLKLSKIRPEVRIRDVKNALTERGVKPVELTWRSQRGVCYLHFGKIRGKEPVQDEPISIDEIIANLQEMRVGPALENPNENDFIVVDLVKKPITRIEIVNATAV